MKIGLWTQRLNRVKNHTSTIQFFMVCILFFKSGYSTFSLFLYFVLGLLFMIYLILDIKYFWAQEMEYATLKNPTLNEMCEDIKEIKERLK